MEKEEYIESNAVGYIKIDKLTISNIKLLKEEYMRIKEKIVQEILKENNINIEVENNK
tara:strand:+ start:949 stop:1122 length:174 start_codon:yes stop_codon:yes gene_type:complete